MSKKTRKPEPDHPNIFLMPCGAPQTNEHLHNTVLKPVPRSVIVPAIPEEDRPVLEAIYGARYTGIEVWGSVDGPSNRRLFRTMNRGDYLIFTVGKEIRVVAQIAVKFINPELSTILWPNDEGRVFSLIYMLENVEFIRKPLADFYEACGYSPKYILRGLTRLSDERRQAFFEEHRNVYLFFEVIPF